MTENDSTDYAIRQYDHPDRDQLVDLWRRVFPDDPPRNAPERVIESKLRVQPELLLVAEGGSRVVGAVMAGYDGFRGWIYHLGVLPEHQRRGVGTMLVRTAEERLLGLGCVKVNLQIRSSNAAVAEFYRSLGYAAEDRLSMRRLLPAASQESRTPHA